MGESYLGIEIYSNKVSVCWVYVNKIYLKIQNNLKKNIADMHVTHLNMYCFWKTEKKTKRKPQNWIK